MLEDFFLKISIRRLRKVKSANSRRNTTEMKRTDGLSWRKVKSTFWAL